VNCGHLLIFKPSKPSSNTHLLQQECDIFRFMSHFSGRTAQTDSWHGDASRSAKTLAFSIYVFRFLWSLS